jgi:hypothetical protein
MTIGLFWIRARRKGISEFAGVDRPAPVVAQVEGDTSN